MPDHRPLIASRDRAKNDITAICDALLKLKVAVDRNTAATIAIASVLLVVLAVRRGRRRR